MLFPKLNEKIEKLANHPHAVKFIFPVAFLDGIISPVPPEVLIVPLLAYRKDLSWKKIALISGLGSLAGAIGMYLIGYFFYSTIGVTLVEHFGVAQRIEEARSLFKLNSVWVMWTLTASSFTFLDRALVLAAGVFKASLIYVATGIFLGRFLRALITSYFAHRYGAAIKKYLTSHIKFTFFVIVALIIIGWFFYKT